MERMETYESNSREWLKQRQKGTGGSDLSGILKLDPEYGYSNYMKILESKTVDFDAMDDDEFKVTSQNEHGAIHGALERGDAWEPMIANVFASHHPETTLIHSKSTWRSKNDPEQRSEEHTSELQSRGHLVCRLLLEKTKCQRYGHIPPSPEY